MRRVIVESPYAGNVALNESYVRACMHDCLMRGEAPYASHALYTQPGVLNDLDHEERRLGMEAGWVWMKAADAVVAYTDRGWSRGMREGVERAEALGLPVEERRLSEEVYDRMMLAAVDNSSNSGDTIPEWPIRSSAPGGDWQVARWRHHVLWGGGSIFEQALLLFNREVIPGGRVAWSSAKRWYGCSFDVTGPVTSLRVLRTAHGAFTL